MQPLNLLRRTCLATVALVALSAPGSKPARPQPLPLPVPGIGWPGVSSDDVARMHAAAAQLYESESRPIGAVERWHNPDTKDAGEVQLIRSFSERGIPCRAVRYTIRYEGSQNRVDHYLVNWCHIQGAGWKIVEFPRSVVGDASGVAGQ
jgi:hypothetical protein